MITLLQQYLAINTAHPYPDYASAIALFKKYALNDGFLICELVLPSGNPMLIITLQGTSSTLPALALNHHMDVVPAENTAQWLFPAFAGTIDNDIIYGRGTQDCKGVGIAQYAALKQLKKEGPQPTRTIHFIMVPDEERGGHHGTREFLQHPLFASLNIGYVLDEGMASGKDQELLIKIDERTPIQIQVTSSGQQSHASGLLHENCILPLVNFLSDVATFQIKQQSGLFDQPGNLISMQITSLKTNNSALNVIPSLAQATIDVRIPSTISYHDGVALIDRIIKKHTNVSYEILATSEERFKAVKTDSSFYQTLAESISSESLTPKPFVFEATTDARFYSHRGIQAIGFTPFTVKPNLHGTNENIYTRDLTQGTKIINNFLRAFCTSHN